MQDSKAFIIFSFFFSNDVNRTMQPCRLLKAQAAAVSTVALGQPVHYWWRSPSYHS